MLEDRMNYYAGKMFAIGVVLCAAISARAEIVMHLHSVKVVAGTETISGYLVLPYKEDLDLSTSEGIAFVKSLPNRPWIYEAIDRTAKFSTDFGQFKFTTRKPRSVDNKKIVSITKLDWEFDDEEPGAIATVSPADAKLLKTMPIAYCKSKMWDGDFWLSYNPAVTAKDLENMCERTFDTRPSDAEQQALLKKGNVVHFTYPAED